MGCYRGAVARRQEEAATPADGAGHQPRPVPLQPMDSIIMSSKRCNIHQILSNSNSLAD
jgi:hypothetical protein